MSDSPSLPAPLLAPGDHHSALGFCEFDCVRHLIYISGIMGYVSFCGWLISLAIILPFDPAIPLPDSHPEELQSGSQRDIETPVSIAALLTIAKMWKQL